MFILVTTSSIGLYLGAPYLLAMFGHDFLPGHVILAIILTFQVISSVFGLSTTVLGATGEENFLYKLPIYGVLFYFVMQTGTIPLGILSVPVSLGLTLVFINGLAAVRVSRTLGFDISIFGVLKEFWSIQKTR
jgi:O-antigen/teichoic acid export membrane protein